MGRKLGYARVSTQDQNLELQIDALTKFGVEQRDIFMEKVTGSRKDRPELEKLLSYVRKGDTIVVWKLDRIGRSLKHLIDLMERFKQDNVHFVSLHENIDTTTATGKLMFNIMASLAEFERDMIIERTRAGLDSARARGRKGGRPAKDRSKVNLALSMYDSKQFTVAQIEEATGLKKPTIYKYLNQRKNHDRTASRSY